MTSSPATELTPTEITAELDRFIVGQHDAKRAVAIALRNRWRRQQVEGPLRDEITPKNILMIGPTGVGKTEIARRLAKLAKAPFIKVEATKFTEVGYVGRDVDSIIRDLMEVALLMVRERHHEEVRVKAEANAEERILNALVGETASEETRRKFREKLRDGELEDKEIDIERGRYAGRRRIPELRHSRHARRPDGHAQFERYAGQRPWAGAPRRGA